MTEGPLSLSEAGDKSRNIGTFSCLSGFEAREMCVYVWVAEPWPVSLAWMGIVHTVVVATAHGRTIRGRMLQLAG